MICLFLKLETVETKQAFFSWKGDFFMIKSEVVQFRSKQALHDEAAHLGLYGFAAVARHAFIETRMESYAGRLVELMRQGKVEQADELAIQMQQECRG